MNLTIIATLLIGLMTILSIGLAVLFNFYGNILCIGVLDIELIIKDCETTKKSQQKGSNPGGIK